VKRDNPEGISQLIVSAGAEAQTTTLFYQSTAMTGTSDYLAAGATGLTTAPIVGSVSGTLVFTGSLAAGDLDVTSYDFTFFGNNGSPVTVDAPAGPGPGVIVGNGQFFGLGTNFSVTTANGAIIGGSGNLVNEGYHTSTTALTIGSTGDAFQYQYATVDGSCQNQIGVTAKDPAMSMYRAARQVFGPCRQLPSRCRRPFGCC
jgi:hypothetical protein